MAIKTEAYVVHEADGPFKLEQVQYQDVGEHELLVEPVAVSLCHTDVRAAGGTFLMTPPMIPGHESAGTGKYFHSKDEYSTTVPSARSHVIGYWCDRVPTTVLKSLRREVVPLASIL